MRRKISLLRLWFFSLFIGAFLSTFWAAVPGEASQGPDFVRNFQSPRLEFPEEGSVFTSINPGRYPPYLMWFFQKALQWQPLGDRGDYTFGCRPEDLYQKILQSPKAPEQAQIIEEHKKSCGKHFQSGSRWALINSLRIMSMKLDVAHHSLIRRVIVNLPGGTRVKGLLALKGDNKKRPFVVVRLGIFSNVEEFLPERFLLMQLYEQGLANVLVLENMTSADFIAYNSRYSLGGFDEGVQNIQVAQILRDPQEPLSQLISSLHFVGMSLGGHGVLFASLVNKANSRGNQLLIQSFTGLCPVVKLKDTLDSLTRRGPLGLGADYWSYLRLEGLRKKVPELDGYPLLKALTLKPQFLPRVMADVAQKFPIRRPDLGLVILPPPPFQIDDFWKANDFWSLYRNVSSSVLVLGSEKDAMVSPVENLHWLKDNAPFWNSQIGVVVLEESFHCTLPIAYDWSTITALLNARIMSMDPSREAPLGQAKIEISSQVTALFVSTSETFLLESSWTPDGKLRLRYRVGETIEGARFTIEAPLQGLDFKFHQSLTSADRVSVERWVRQNLQVRVSIEDRKVFALMSWPRILSDKK